ncbi:barstar family protein [Chitinophaga sp. ARDCPP14]|uniref:barstar family protein n=1 Tax=Chitinophaga sp. ARDCPP14 TaxID=3391139 RepID=UPI003F5252D9
MSIKQLKINVNEPVSKWHDLLMNNSYANDFILFETDQDRLIWFMTNYTQYLVRKGANEVVPLYGNAINSLETFIYQVNLSLPVGYQLGPRLDALYDLLLNFETEPERRFIIWNDSSYLFNNNKADFESIFEKLIVAAYCNRNGISTMKEDGTRYKVDQRNIFIFNDNKLKDIRDLLDKEYFIPSIDEQYQLDKILDFNLIELIEI